MARKQHVIQSKFARRSVLGCAVLLFACLAGTGCGEPSDDQVQTQGAALEGDPLDGKCSRIAWQRMPGRYLDAQVGNVTTRTYQDNTTQLWCFTRLDSLVPSYTIQHRHFNGQFLDAYGRASKDYRVVLRDAAFLNGEHHPDQVWRFSGRDRLFQVSTWRFLDGHASSSKDYRAVTRNFDLHISQNWDVEALPPPPVDPSCPPPGNAPCPPDPPPPPPPPIGTGGT